MKESDNSAPATYRIRQGDKLSVKFFTNPDLNEPTLTVRPDGYISLQIINEIRAEGLTTSELKTKLEKAYDETLLTPIITVSVIDFVAPHVFISGYVAKPGRYEVRDAKTLMELIAMAGGFTREANRKMVVHARPDGSGDWRIQPANVADILKRNSKQRDVILRDGDHVYVPESKMSQFTRAVESFRGLLPRYF
ncbi:MAG: polysaccharide biosynthesis/export family protein [Pyrinomonadaceae bacterium]